MYNIKIYNIYTIYIYIYIINNRLQRGLKEKEERKGEEEKKGD